MNNKLLESLQNIYPERKKFIELLRYELESTIYGYGSHHKANKNSYLKRIRYESIVTAKRFLNHFTKTIHSSPKTSKQIINGSYFNTQKLPNALAQLGYDIAPVPWNNVHLKNYSLLHYIETYKSKILFGDFNSRTSKELYNLYEVLFEKLCLYFEDARICGLIVPFDLPFWEKTGIEIFKMLQKPSFVFLHGLPARYNNIDDNRADYLLVWGNAIKRNYVTAGVNPDKIFITGHPGFTKPINLKSKLRFDLRNVLVLTKAMNGAPVSTDQIILSDRANTMYYPYAVQSVLYKLGIKTAILRPHPSENPNWYKSFIDTSFYSIDKRPLNEALAQSTLVIGPSSTVLLQSLFAGVNYSLFEPCDSDGKDLLGYPLVNPFDGSDPRIPCARSEEELSKILDQKKFADVTCVKDYIQYPFECSFIKDLIQ